MATHTLPELDAQRLLAALATATGRPQLAYAEAPHPLRAGGEAVVDAFRLAGAPAELSGPLVLRRVLPIKDAQQVRWEGAVHGALHELGFPVPRALHVEADPAVLGAPFVVMDRLAGGQLLADVMRPSGLLARPLRLPGIIWEALVRVPRLLGETQARLHGLAPESFEARLRDAGFSPEDLSLVARINRLAARVAGSRLPGLTPGIAWLRRELPREGARVICHGDFVFTNLFVEQGRVTGVFDWSYVTLAEPGFDVAASIARLSSAVPDVPAPLGAVFRAVQRLMVRSYLRAYRRQRPLDTGRLGFYEAFWILNELVWSGERLAAGAVPDGAIEQRWLHAAAIDAGVARFAANTGVRLEPRRPQA